MKSFIFSMTIFGGVITTTFFALLSLADPHSLDASYGHFINGQKRNLLIGSSRAAQCFRPQVFGAVLKDEFYNFSFTIDHSPYGPTYLKKIKEKLNKEDNNVFVLEVNPWILSSKTTNPNDSINFREKTLCLGRSNISDKKVNFSYLTENLGGSYYRILLHFYPFQLHSNGWLEVTKDIDSSSVNSRTQQKINMYRNEYMEEYAFSDLRIKYLNETIKYLSEFGEVFLVRLPICPEIYEIENEYVPNFSKKIKELMVDQTSDYLDLSQLKNIKFNDGNHISRKSSEEVSHKIASWIDLHR